MKKALMMALAVAVTTTVFGCDNRSELERNVDEAAGDVRRTVNDATD